MSDTTDGTDDARAQDAGERDDRAPRDELRQDEPRRDDRDAPGNYVAGEGADVADPPEPNEPG